MTGNRQEIIRMGRKLNHVLENIQKLNYSKNNHDQRSHIEIILNEIYTLFINYKKGFSEIPYNETYSTKDKLRAKEVVHCIKTYLILYRARYSLKTLLSLAKTIFIQLYLIIYDNIDPYPNSRDIQDYHKPITFYEHEMNYIENLMKDL